MKILPRTALFFFHAGGQADRRDEANTISRSFTKASKNAIYIFFFRKGISILPFCIDLTVNRVV